MRRLEDCGWMTAPYRRPKIALSGGGADRYVWYAPDRHRTERHRRLPALIHPTPAYYAA